MNPPDFSAEIAELEAELLRMYPRGKATSMKEVRASPAPKLHRYKYICKRLWALRRGEDLPVDVWVSPTNPKRCFARVMRAPGVPTIAEPSASELAFTLNLPLETVEVALQRRPSTLDPRHLAEWVLTVADTLAHARTLRARKKEQRHEARQPPADDS